MFGEDTAFTSYDLSISQGLPCVFCMKAHEALPVIIMCVYMASSYSYSYMWLQDHGGSSVTMLLDSVCLCEIIDTFLNNMAKIASS